MNIQGYTLSRAVHRRESLQRQLLDDLERMNEDFHGNPSRLDMDTTYRLLQQLRQVNAHIEEKKNEAKERRCCRCLSRKWVKPTTYVILGIHFISWMAVGGIGIYNLATAEEDSERGRDAAEVAITVAALFLTSVVGVAVKEIDDERDKFELFSRVSSIEKQGEEHFQEFLMAFDSFKRSQETEADEQKKRMSHCIHQLDKLPETGYRSRIPSRDHWISLMVQMLPDNHPIKTKFMELRAAAMTIFELKEEGGEVVYSAPSGSHPHVDGLRMEKADLSSSDRKPSKGKVKFVKGNDSESSTLSSSPGRRSRRKFSGERLSLPAWLKPRQKPQAAKSAPLDSDEEEVAFVKPPIEDYKALYGQDWSRLEGELGTRLNCLHLGGHWFDRECNISDRQEELPSFRAAPAPRSESEELFEDAEDLV